jgi:hypothetical protein
MTTMPPHTKDQDSKDVHVVTLPLYNSSKKGPAYDEVKQGARHCQLPSRRGARSAGLHPGGQ